MLEAGVLTFESGDQAGRSRPASRRNDRRYHLPAVPLKIRLVRNSILFHCHQFNSCQARRPTSGCEGVARNSLGSDGSQLHLQNRLKCGRPKRRLLSFFACIYRGIIALQTVCGLRPKLFKNRINDARVEQNLPIGNRKLCATFRRINQFRLKFFLIRYATLYTHRLRSRCYFRAPPRPRSARERGRDFGVG